MIRAVQQNAKNLHRSATTERATAMSKESYSSAKKHRSDEHSRERDGDNDRRERRGREESSSRDRKRERDRRKRSKRSDRDDYSRDKKRKKDSRRSKRDRYSDDDSDDYRRKKKKSKKEKRSAKARSSEKPDKSKLISMGEPIGRSPESLINVKEDYYSFHHEFWIYLFREEGTCFNDLDTKDARAAFARFAKCYNAGELEEPYYSRNFPNEVIEESKTTKHSWGFKTTQTERKGLGDLQKGVRRQTEYSSRDQKSNLDVRNLNNVRSNEVSCAPVESLAQERFRRRTPEERLNERRADRRMKEHIRNTQEELTGGPKDLKERRLEKKREHSARIHGAHRDHEAAASGMELSDAALFGDDGTGQDSFKAAMGRSRLRKERREERQKNRIQELKLKEEERQQNMLKMLGLENLQGQGKVEIQPRK